ncbi:MAG: response regulator [Lachnospiraceae bacterium]|nr:response regulator [Lachnospiraceae bacterium]
MDKKESKTIVFISDRESFILKTIIKNVKAAGYNCVFSLLTVNDIMGVKDEMQGVIYLYIDDATSLDRMGATYLRDLCLDTDQGLYLMGNKDDIDALKEELFKDVVHGVFYRPINANQLTDDIIVNMSDENRKHHQKHILVVDDSGAMLTTIKEWLGGKYRVTPVNSAMNAITFLAKQRPDLILLDYEMPVCSGAQFLEMLRNDTNNGDVPVIFLTGKGDEQSVKSVLALKPAGYLLKSLPKETIVGEIDAFFKRQKGV